MVLEGDSTYNALQVDLRRRFSHGLTLRGVYTFSKALDNGDSLNQTTANNAPGLVSNPYNLPPTKASPHSTSATSASSVPSTSSPSAAAANSPTTPWLGQPHRRLGLASVVTAAVRLPHNAPAQLQPVQLRRHPQSRSALSSILTSRQVIIGNPVQWFNPAAFLAPPSTSGFSGNLGRDTYTGPGLATWDFGGHKDTTLREGLTLQFRAELFNILNRANFNTPNLITFTPHAKNQASPAPPAPSPAPPPASRQVQFGLKLLW